MTIDIAIEELHRSENELAARLHHIGDRHRADHDVFHMAHQLATWSERHIAELAKAGRRHGLSLDEQPSDPTHVLRSVREAASSALSHRKEPGLLLLADMRELYGLASTTSLDWEVLSQAAHATRERELLATAEFCMQQSRRQEQWAEAVVKETAAQALVT